MHINHEDFEKVTVILLFHTSVASVVCVILITLLRKLTCVISYSFQIMISCFEVFTTWDDEYEKLQTLLRDIVKKKREESMKMVWRVNPAHKRLQARLDQMRK